MTSQKQIEREKSLKNIITSIRSFLQIDEIKSLIANEVGKAFNADRCFVQLFDPNSSNFLEVQSYSEYVSNEKSLAGYKFSQRFNMILSLHYKNDKEFIVFDVSELAKDLGPENVVARTFSKVFNCKSVYHFPMFNDGNLIGVFGIHYSKEKVALSNEELELLRIIADYASIAIKHAEIYSLTKKQAERENLLRKVTERIRSSLDIDEVINKTCLELFNLFNVDKVVLSKYTEQDNHPVWTFLVEHQSDNSLPMMKNVDPTYETSSYFAKCIFGEGKNIVIDNIDKSDYPDYFTNIYKKLKVKSLLAIPIVKDGLNWGAIGLLQNNNYRKWTPEEINLISTIADSISIAIKQAELFSIIKKQLEREDLLRSDESVIVNKNLAKNLGLNCAITYSTLASKYHYLKDEGKVSDDGFFRCSIKDLERINFLNDLEQRHAIEKLVDVRLIKYKKGKDHMFFRVLEDEEYVKHYISEPEFEEDVNIPIDHLNSENKFEDFTELCNAYSKYFPKKSVKAAIHFLKKSKEIKKSESPKVSRLYFSVVCRTLHDFMRANDLKFNDIKSLIDHWFAKNDEITSSKVVELNSPSRLMINRLKKILFYRFQEARLIIATDFNSKIDFYSCLDVNDLAFLKELSNDDF